jgi:DNA-binding response OmpR family regulator
LVQLKSRVDWSSRQQEDSQVDRVTKILVIDDEPQIRQVIVRTLTLAGHEMLEAKDGKEGLCLFRAHQPTLVITDLLMPQGEGLETIRELRRESAALVIIAMSGRGAMYLETAKEFGADATIAKPFRATELLAAVTMLLTSPPRADNL